MYLVIPRKALRSRHDENAIQTHLLFVMMRPRSHAGFKSNGSAWQVESLMATLTPSSSLSTR